MANYETGLDTKARILDACKILLYRNGFDKTTFKAIAEEANVNQGLLVYHYKTKNNMANQVFQDVMTELMDAIAETFPEAEQLVQYFISDYLYFRMIFEDEHFRDYIRNCCLKGVLNKDLDNMTEDYEETYHSILNYLEDSFVREVNFDEGLQAAYEGAKTSYSVYICNSYQRMTYDVATTNYIAIYCHLMDVPQKIYGPKMLEAQLLCNQVEVSIEDMHLRMRRSHHMHTKYNQSL